MNTQRSDPNRTAPNTLEQKLECIKKGNPFYKKIQELKKKHYEKSKNIIKQ